MINFKKLSNKELEDLIIKCNDQYYNNDESELSDFDYDCAKDELRRREPDNKYVKQVGIKVKDDSGWKKAKHNIPMGSLGKINTVEEMNELCKKWHSAIISEYKFDGISLEILYKDGIIIQGITRGDGLIGDDITENIKKMKNVKLLLPYNFTGSLRGEIVLFQDDFVKLNKIEKFKNKRNTASGIAKRLDGKYSEFLSVMYYDVIIESSLITTEINSETNKIEFIKKLGLPTGYIDSFNVENITDNLEKLYIDFVESERAKLQFDIDGLVLKIDDLKIQDSLGIKDGIPKGQMAWKFPNMSARTKLIRVEWQFGLTGRLTPVAIYIPIDIGGATLNKASLSNLSIFNKFHLHYNDEILVARMNDVIPNVLKNYGGGDKSIKIPTICPYCGEKLIIDSKFLVCSNDACEGNIVGNLKKYANVIFEEKGVGDSTVELLYEYELVKEPSDFYKLKMEELLRLPGFANKKAENLLNVINAGRKIELNKFIGGLNLKNFGRSRAELLIKKGYNTFEKMRNITFGELINIDGIGDNIADCFLSSLKKKETIINNLLDQDIKLIVNQISKSFDGVLSGKSFCFTGKIQREENGERLKRSDMEKLVKDNGGIVSSVNKNLTYLVQADPNSISDKSEKAKSLGTKILSEEDFFKMLGM